MPLDRILILVQLAALPVMVCAAWLLSGAWKHRNRPLFAIMGLLLFLAAAFPVGLQSGIVDQFWVARRLPTSMLMLRAMDPALGVKGSPEVLALCHRLERGALGADDLARLLAPPSSPVQPEYVLSAARAITTPQSRGLLRWLDDQSNFKVQGGVNGRAAIAVASSAAAERATDPELVKAICNLLEDPRSDDVLLYLGEFDAACRKLLAHGGPHPQLLQSWGVLMLRFGCKVQSVSQSPDRTLFRLDPNPSREMKFGPIWKMVATPSQPATSPSHPQRPELPNIAWLELRPSTDDPSVLVGEATFSATLDPEHLGELWRSRPFLFPEDLDLATLPRLSVWRRVRLSLDPRKEGSLRSTIVAEGVGS